MKNKTKLNNQNPPNSPYFTQSKIQTCFHSQHGPPFVGPCSPHDLTPSAAHLLVALKPETLWQVLAEGRSPPHSGLSSDLTCSGRPALTSHADPSPSIPSCFPLSIALTLFLHCWLFSVYLPVLQGKQHRGKNLVLLIYQDILGAWTMIATW